MAMLLALVGVLAKRKPRPSRTVDPGTDPSFIDLGSGGFAFLPIGLFVVVGVLAYLSFRARKERIAGCITLAAELGMTYAMDDDGTLLALPFSLLSRGDGRGIENVLHGTIDGLTVDLFDYWYFEESRDAEGHRHRTTHRFTCVSTKHDASGGSLTIEDEGLLSNLAGALSIHDLRFESEAFNRAFRVRASDERFATAVIDARMMAWLLSHARGIHVAIEGDRVLVVQRRPPVAELPTLVSVATGFVARIPRVVASLYPKSG